MDRGCRIETQKLSIVNMRSPTLEGVNLMLETETHTGNGDASPLTLFWTSFFVDHYLFSSIHGTSVGGRGPQSSKDLGSDIRAHEVCLRSDGDRHGSRPLSDGCVVRKESFEDLEGHREEK
jgi:hypothetical protein